MEKFINLPIEKQNAIINAGLAAFSRNGYKKCYVSEIASLAGIAKSMVFHYFGTKKDMYLYLLEFVADTIFNEIKSKAIDAECDFFERIRLATEVKVAVLKRHPSAISFIMRFYFETDKEVEDDIKSLLAQRVSFSTGFALKDIDRNKFKQGVDPNLVLKVLQNFNEGYLGRLQHQPALDIDEMTAEFYQCLNMLKQNLYKEEYL